MGTVVNRTKALRLGLVALQEVLTVAFREDIEPFFSELGYSSIYFKDKATAKETSSQEGMSKHLLINQNLQ